MEQMNQMNQTNEVETQYLHGNEDIRIYFHRLENLDFFELVEELRKENIVERLNMGIILSLFDKKEFSDGFKEKFDKASDYIEDELYALSKEAYLEKNRRFFRDISGGDLLDSYLASDDKSDIELNFFLRKKLVKRMKYIKYINCIRKYIPNIFKKMKI